MPEATHAWDPDQYLTFADERGRPFVELVARIGAPSPRSVVDLGCGAGNLTVLLARRWPDASIVGIDSSAEMVAAAPDNGDVELVVGDIRDWRVRSGPTVELIDVLVSNAAFQWVPGHLDLLGGLLETVAPGGWFAFQVPGNFEEPSHTLLRELATEAPYAGHTAGVATPDAHDAATYLRVLADLGCEVDAWETTYLHVLHGPDAVFEWVSGTGARPTLQALPADLRPAFEEEFKRRLREAYPERDGVVTMPFRRVFVVARRAGAPEQG